MNLGEAARIILEIGDTTLPYKWIAWKKGKKDFLRSAAKTSGKIELLITFDTYLSSGVTEVIFHTNLDTDSYDGEGSWSTTKTGTGNEFKIFSTVKNVIEDYVKKYESERGEREMPLGAIRFSADKAKEGDENSRTSLYRTWAKKYAQQVGGKFEEKKDRYDNTYTIYLPRPKRKLATEAREVLNEIGNFQYMWRWTDWSWGGNGYWFRAEAESMSGPPLKVFIEGDPEDEIEVSFKRAGDGKWSMDKTGQGDEFKIFGTVANIIDAFIERYNKEEASTRPLHKLIFYAAKEKIPSFRGTQYSKGNRDSLYSKMAERLARKYKAKFTQKEYASTTEYGFVFPKQKRKLATESREVLNEIGNFQYKWRWTDWNWPQEKWFRAEAESMSGPPVKVLIEGDPTAKVELSFERAGDGKWSKDKTGQGDEFKIFGTVTNIIEAFIKRYQEEEAATKYPLRKIIITSEKVEGEVTNRASLYRKMVKKFASKYKAKVNEKEFTEFIVFGITFPEQNQKEETIVEASPRMKQKAEKAADELAKQMKDKGWTTKISSKDDEWQYKISINADKEAEYGGSEMAQIYVTLTHPRDGLYTKGRTSMTISYHFYDKSKKDWIRYSTPNRYDFWDKVNGVRTKAESDAHYEKLWRSAHRHGRISDEELADRLKDLGIEEAKIVWNKDQQKKLDKQNSKRRRNEKELFSSGPLKIKWSQARGGYAIFVKGRMEGETFDSIDDAKEYLKDLGIEESTSDIQIKLSKFGQRSSRTGGRWSGSSAGGNIKARITGYSEPAKAHLVDADGKTIESIELPFSKAADGSLNADGKVIFKLADEVHHIFITAANDHKKILHQYAIPNAYKI